MVTKYKIVRMYQRGGKRTIETGLTLEQAQAHCSDPETSSSTCTKAAGKRRTKPRRNMRPTTTPPKLHV